METDRELLEAAARAAGIPYIKPLPEYDGHLGLEAGSENPMRTQTWNPLADDGDALRLAVRLNIEIIPQQVWVWAVHPSLHNTIKEPPGEDPLAATRRAIVRAAAMGGNNANT